ncbi:MAG TPA: cache domain-containing protein [Terriglobales bacterium]|nr:cache domain-containing protein [Terriglobales bacterium]
MKWNSIRTKVLVTLLGCLVVGVAGIVGLMRYSFERNSQALAAESVTGAQKLFTILEAREISKMTAVSEMLATNPQVRDAFAARDRERLLELTAPLYPELKREGITNWMFHTPEPNMVVFLRLHNPSKFGDALNRYIDKQVVSTHALVSGNELAKAGFAVRILRPFPDSTGGVAGYLELGEELGQFIHTMKEQTGSDYGLLLNKNYMDRQFWADSSKVWKRRDDWDDNPNFVIADKTTADNSIFRFQGDLANVPEHGEVLGRFQDGNSVFVRGIFPVRDAAGNTVGAMFVVRDISGFYVVMKHTQTVLVALTIAALALVTVLVLTLLSRLVFRRLDHIVMVATRVVGGDYKTAIHVSSDDEVGQFEQLFEQFRQVFVDVLAHVPELQEQQPSAGAQAREARAGTP